MKLLDFSSRARNEASTQRPGSSLRSAPKNSYKQSSISSGTLGRPHTPTDPKRDVRRPPGRDKYQRAPQSPVTSVHGAGHPMATMLDGDRARSRRERTFVGGECAACEELLEHTLRGERVLQFSCGHVAHEACFYEYIKESDPQSQYCPTCDAPLGLDSFRGGSILDLSMCTTLSFLLTLTYAQGKLSNIVRSVAQKETSPRSSSNTPMPWDRQAPAEDAASQRDMYNRNSRDNSNRDSRDSQRMRIERLGIGNQVHSRNDSGNAPSAEFANETNGNARKHDYDLHAMETTVQNTHPKDSRSSIPYPSVTVRSEFPTLTRSRHQQSLTCLVTIEVPEGKWAPQYDESQNAPPVPPLPSKAPSVGRHEPSATQQFVPFE